MRIIPSLTLLSVFLFLQSCPGPIVTEPRPIETPDFARERFEIFELAYRYADAANRQDAEQFQELWAEEGAEWVLGPPINKTFTGRDSMGQSVSQMLGTWEFFVQLISGGVVTLVDDTHATARFYVSETANAKDGSGNYNLSMYDDELVKVNGEWRFQKRTYKTIFQSSEVQVGTAYGTPDL